MPTVIGIPSSERKGSFNAALLKAAAALAPADFRVEIASIREIPLYDGDLEETEGVPRPVAALKERIASANGLLLATPEYNNSIPGVLKNAIDWLSRPPDDIPRIFGDRPVGLIGATPGMGGTRLSQAAWLPVIRTLGMRPWFGKSLYVSGAGKVFDAAGELVDEKIRKVLVAYMNGFAVFVGSFTPR